MSSNPFKAIDEKNKPSVAVTDYHKDDDLFIIDYREIEHVVITGDKDTDFSVTKSVEEVDRVNRQEFYDSQASEVGILNIIEKVRLSGDTSLLNQTGRVSMPGVEKDALDRPVEDIVDVSRYQVSQIDALESYKKGASSFDSLDPELKKKMSFEQVAKMSDKEIDEFLASRTKQADEKSAEGE